MKKTVICFASTRYWRDADSLNAAFLALTGDFRQMKDTRCFLLTEKDADIFPQEPDELLVAIPMSGAVQARLLEHAARFAETAVYAAYVSGNGLQEIETEMTRCNAAPAVMECWSVLHRTHRCASLALDRKELQEIFLCSAAAAKVRHSRILLLGEVEPWVVSVDRNPDTYRKYGIELIQIPQDEVKQCWEKVSEEDARPYIRYFTQGSSRIVEPSAGDITRAARMAAALLRILESYQADGMAIACFNLLQTGTTACLGTSYINDCTEKFAACEGDLDSAVTMLILKQLARTKPWIANPGLHSDGTVNFFHCTAPLAALGGEKLPFILRNHHESGIGVALAVELPEGKTVTACRFSGVTGAFTIHRGISIAGPEENVCRTQLYVRFEDFDHYRNTVLGCHQVLVFEDISVLAAQTAARLNLKVSISP